MRISDWSSDVCSSDLGSAENAARPIDVIGVEELADRGIPSILDLLKAMPSSSGAVGDTNLISSAAIGRVEVLKDGASALYGSDAIAGVVNFMTRTDQRGLALAGEFRVLDGPEGAWLLSCSYGHQFVIGIASVRARVWHY